MARKTYYRPYRRTYGSKAHWASNLRQGLLGQNGDVLCENAVQSQSVTPTPVILKCGNFKVQGDITVNVSNAGSVSVNVFLLYCPEGISTSMSGLEAAIQQHPEWIMGWTSVDTPASGTGVAAGNRWSISSRLKRNLNSGDRIVIYTQGTGTATFTFGGAYTATFFTRAN